MSPPSSSAQPSSTTTAASTHGWEVYYITWGTTHASFRLPELQSITQLLNIPYRLLPFDDPSLLARQPFAKECGLLGEWDLEGRPTCLVAFQSDEDARRLCGRMISVRSIHKLYAVAPTFEELDGWLRALPAGAPERVWEQDIGSEGGAENPCGVRWRWTVDSYAFASTSIREKLRTLEHLDLKGQVDVKNPDVELHLLAEYPLRLSGKELDPTGPPPPMVACWFGRLIAHTNSSTLINKYSLKTRAHIGNTSMQSDISLLMASQALASPGKAVWDPFAGTGSMLLTCAEFGCVAWGSDIDGRQMRGVSSSSREKRLERARKEGVSEDTPGILHSALQYGTKDRIMDLMTFDVTRNPFRLGQMFDAIVTDPPYGVRAGAKRIGRKDPTKTRTQPFVFPEGHPDAGKMSHAMPDYIPPFKPYEIADLAVDLVRLARYALRPGGRLVFFLPVVSDKYEAVDVPLVEGMTVVGNSVEDFGKWARRLITLELASDALPVPPPVFDSEPFSAGASSSPSTDGVRTEDVVKQMEELNVKGGEGGVRKEPGHKDFRGQYFRQFKDKDP